MNCNCKNGSDSLDFITPTPGATEASATYQIGLTHFTCGCRKVSVNDNTHPVIGALNATVIGEPQNLGNGAYCCEILLAGTVTYRQCGCCSPRTEYVSLVRCLPCPSEAIPALTVGNVVCSPEPIPYYGNGCCQGTMPGTNKIAITTSITITPAA